MNGASIKKYIACELHIQNLQDTLYSDCHYNVKICELVYSHLVGSRVLFRYCYPPHHILLDNNRFMRSIKLYSLEDVVHADSSGFIHVFYVYSLLCSE